MLENQEKVSRSEHRSYSFGCAGTEYGRIQTLHQPDIEIYGSPGGHRYAGNKADPSENGIRMHCCHRRSKQRNLPSRSIQGETESRNGTEIRGTRKLFLERGHLCVKRADHYLGHREICAADCVYNETEGIGFLYGEGD